jgi:hypothetical protein
MSFIVTNSANIPNTAVLRDASGNFAAGTITANLIGNISGSAGSVSGIILVANGGTGLSTLTANAVILGNGTSTPTFVLPGTSGNVLTSNGTTWTSAAPSGGVSSLNSLTGALSILAGTGISVTPSGANITIATTGVGAYGVNLFTLSPTDITNKFVTLSGAPDNAGDTILTVVGGPMQSYGTDFVVSGAQLGWSGLFLDGVLTSGDMLVVQYN